MKDKGRWYRVTLRGVEGYKDVVAKSCGQAKSEVWRSASVPVRYTSLRPRVLDRSVSVAATTLDDLDSRGR